MKDKNTAATLAFFGGFLGLHKFYLEQQGAGIFYVFLTAVTVRIFAMPLAVLLGVIDCMVLLSMSEEDFDTKYNQKGSSSSRSANRRQERQRRAGPNNRYERYQERERQRRRGGRDQATSRRSNRGRKRAEAPNRQAPPARKSRSTARRTANPKLKAELEEGIRYFKDYEFDRAIESFEEVLQLDPSNVAAHFNLGCAFSAEENRDKAFYHLDRAVALGFNDFERIRTHDSLAFLRVQDRFQEFADNGFRLVQDIPSPEKTAGDPIAPKNTAEEPTPNSTPTGDLLEQLSQLAELREKGLLTEAEFASQKKRLLG